MPYTLDGKLVTDQEARQAQGKQMQWLENGDFEKLINAEFFFSETVYQAITKKED